MNQKNKKLILYIYRGGILMSFIIKAIVWTLAFYGLFEIIKTILYITIHTNLRSSGIYMIIGVKNQEKEIEGILRSIIFKILYGKEEQIKDIVVADLNSNDNTKEIIQRLEEEYECIKVVNWRECKEILDAVDNSQLES